MLYAKKDLKAQRSMLKTLQHRATASFLPDLVTSRPTTKFNRECGGLPGIGHPYWQTARAHNYAGSFPPQLSPEIQKIDENPTEAQIQETLAILKHMWQPEPGIAKFSPMWVASRVQSFEDQSLLYIPVKSLRAHQFQDGTDNPRQRLVKLFHGTREQNVSSILRQGLQCSPVSHGAIGVWLNASLNAALTWTPTCVDLLPALAIEIQTEPQSIHQNRAISAGSTNRYIAKPGANMLPPLEITGLWIGVPTWNRLAWYAALRKQFSRILQFCWTLELDHTLTGSKDNIERLADRLHKTVAQKLAYGVAVDFRNTEVGTHTGPEFQAVIQLSVPITEILWTLQLDSLNHRQKNLQQFEFHKLPQPFQKFLISRWPNICEFTGLSGHTQLSGWCIGPTVWIHKIGATLSSSSALCR